MKFGNYADFLNLTKYMQENQCCVELNIALHKIEALIFCPVFAAI